MTQKRLRIQHVLVQPVLVWDDGEELTPAPEAQAMALPLSKLSEVIAGLPDQLAKTEAALLAQKTDEDQAGSDSAESSRSEIAS